MAKTKDAKAKSVFYCTDCGNEFPRWSGQCTICKAWNTIFEGPSPDRAPAGAARRSRGTTPAFGGATAPVVLRDVDDQVVPRILTGLAEFDFVLGGGIVPGGLILLGGEPGIGKSTILTQVAARLTAGGQPVLYASGEESAQQVRLRATRLGQGSDAITFVAETEIGRILEHALRLTPTVLMVDSIQTVYSDEIDGQAGSPSQVKECAAHLQRFAKSTGIAVFIIGHVTKDGALGGPKTLEHAVDTVIYFEHADGDHRIMRTSKNRFGSVDEIGVFRMTEQGLEPVANPSELFLADRATGGSGSAVTAVIEGTRPVLVEVQGLVTIASYGSPQRVATGYSRKRLALLVAVLEKRVGLAFSTYDAFLNIAGGIELTEPAGDAAVVAALASSAYDIPLPANALFLGEVGLGGELRRVGQVERRLAEAAKMGFTTVYLAERSMPRQIPPGISVIGVGTVADMIRRALDVVPRRSQAPADVEVTMRRGDRRGGRVDGRSRTGHRTALAIRGDGDGTGET